MRFIALVLLIGGLLAVAGGTFLVYGLIATGLGAYLYDKAAVRSRGWSEILTATVLLAGGVGALAVVGQFVVQRVTALP
jgi:hypothetical protein